MNAAISAVLFFDVNENVIPYISRGQSVPKIVFAKMLIWKKSFASSPSVESALHSQWNG